VDLTFYQLHDVDCGIITYRHNSLRMGDKHPTCASVRSVAPLSLVALLSVKRFSALLRQYVPLWSSDTFFTLCQKAAEGMHPLCRVPCDMCT